MGDQPYEPKKKRLSPLFWLAKGKSRTMHDLRPKEKEKKKKKISLREARANNERRRKKLFST
jgi:hypothetical protein